METLTGSPAPDLSGPGPAVLGPGERSRRIVGWRSWFVSPDPTPGENCRPMLTGMFGFPWRTGSLDAKCLWRDQVPGPLVGTATSDRYHLVVPDPGCSCGIYASPGPQFLPPAGRRTARPVASGFVELSGRAIWSPSGWRAQHATIIGPLTLSFAPRRPAAVIMRLTRRPAGELRVVEDRDGYRVVSTHLRAATPIGQWAARTAPLLALRYQVDVVGPAG